MTKQIPQLDIANTYWFDESSINSAMTRFYGWAKSCNRVCDYVPDSRFERTSIMAAIGICGIIAPFIFKGTLDRDVFTVYICEVLIKELKSGDTLILDNARVHTVKGIMKPLTDMGVNVIFLPRYSPDFNPIELAWSKMKTYLRKVKARDYTTLVAVIPAALEYITSEDIAGWIRHCKYAL